MIPNPYPGIFIAIDGIDGCGKSTQVKMLADWLRQEIYPTPALGSISPGRVILETKEPNKEGRFGRMIYADLAKHEKGLNAQDPFRFQMWYACDSKEHLQHTVIPRLELGGIVISDRFRSSLVYGAKDREDIPNLMSMNQTIIGEHFIWPDMIFIIDVPPDVAIERLKQKGRALDGHEQIVTLARTRDYYSYFASFYPNCKPIWHEGDPSPSAKAEFIQYHVRKLLEQKPYHGV